MKKQWHLEVILTDPAKKAFTLTRSHRSVEKIWTEFIEVAKDMVECSKQLEDDQSPNAIEALKLMLTLPDSKSQ